MKSLALARAKGAGKVKALEKAVEVEKVQRFASVFDALADTPQEATNLRARAQLASQINHAIRDKGWTQAAAAAHCGVTQPRINDLINGHISRFSLDALVNIASEIGEVNVELVLKHV
jgi:predicted XRE-type DNA-binding protein